MSARLRFTTGAWCGRDIAIPEPEATIGRAPGADIVIAEEDRRFVSRNHLAIVKEGDRYVVVDLQSRNGTWVNGQRVERVVLADGDEIQFGRRGPRARFGYGGLRAAARSPESRRPNPFQTAAGHRVVQEAEHHSIRRRRRRLVLVFGAVGVAFLTALGAVWLLRMFEGPEGVFRRLATAYEGGVVLIEVGVIYDGGYRWLTTGSGFFAAEGGWIVTNKHVVHSDLYDEGSACLAEAFRRRGLSLEQALIVTVWPGGSQFRRGSSSGAADRDLGYSTEHGTLSLVASAPDDLTSPRPIRCADPLGGPGLTFPWRRHAVDNNDLAVLRASTSVAPLPLSTQEPAAEDEIMVLGFPTGTTPLETSTAEPLRRVGRVLRVHDTIQIDAVVLPGNSGGPLVDRRGRVVGVATRGTAESFNMAIKIEHARRLLEDAGVTP